MVEKSIEEQAAEMTARIMEKMRAEETEAGVFGVGSLEPRAGGWDIDNPASSTVRSPAEVVLMDRVWERVFAAEVRGFDGPEPWYASGRGCRRQSSPVELLTSDRGGRRLGGGGRLGSRRRRYRARLVRSGVDRGVSGAVAGRARLKR